MYNDFMPYKNKEDQKKAAASWYQKNKKKTIERSLKSTAMYRKRNKEFVNQYKLEQGCKDCGYNKYAVALDFDHTSDDKEANVCRMVTNALSLEKIIKEIKKCDVVCANCHRVRTWKRLQ